MKKNILLLMTDQQRLDYTSYSGRGVVETPNIDRISESVGFTRCQTVSPVCTPARTSLVTGKYPHQIGMLAMSGDLSLEYPTFMQALQKGGYHTSGIGKFHFLQTWVWSTARGCGVDLVQIKDQIRQFGFDDVWETSGKQLALKNYCDYCRHMDEKGLLEQYRDFVDSVGPDGHTPDKNSDDGNAWPFDEEDYVDVLTADRIIERIKGRPSDRPFYIFGSFCSPHKPYDPPGRYLDKIPYEEVDDFVLEEGVTLSKEDKKRLYRQRRAAKAMVKLIDDQVGRIFDVLEEEDILKDTVILFTSDHGDMLGDHNRIQKIVPWKQCCTVPLAIRHPDFLNKHLNSSPVELIDVAATILGIAGLDPQKALSKSWPAFNDIVPCRSLLPIVTGEKDKIREFTFTECKFTEDKTAKMPGRKGNWQMIQNEQWKYVRYLGYDEPGKVIEEFYDLAEDEAELNNRVNDENYKGAIKWCRDRREYVLDHTPAAQTTWAPLIAEPWEV